MEANLKIVELTKDLNKIFGKTLDFIEDEKRKIHRIRENLRFEYENLEKELINLKKEASALTSNVNKLNLSYKLNQAKMDDLSTHSEVELKTLYQEIEGIKVQLDEQKNKELLVFQRRNNVENQIGSIKNLSEHADKMSMNYSIIISILNGDIDKGTDIIDNKTTLGIKILQVQEEERRRIAREIHDSLAQELSQILLNVQYSIKVIDKDIDLAKQEMNSLKEDLRESINSIRRLIYDLRPTALENLGLIPIIKKELDSFRLNYKNINMKLIVSPDLESNKVKMSKTMTLTIYRIFQESINNIIKHSQAKNVIVNIYTKSNSFYFDIEDDGVGFNSKHTEENPSSIRGFGLSIMKERVNLLHGSMSIEHTNTTGTKISISIPLS